MWRLNKYVASITKERQGFEKTLAAAVQMTAGDTDFNRLIQKYIESLKYPSFDNPSNINVNMDIPKETEQDVQNEDGGANLHSIEDFVEEGSKFQINEHGSDAGTGNDAMVEWGPETQRLAVEIVEKASVSGFYSPGAMIGPLTQETL